MTFKIYWNEKKIDGTFLFPSLSVWVYTTGRAISILDTRKTEHRCKFLEMYIKIFATT